MRKLSGKRVSMWIVMIITYLLSQGKRYYTLKCGQLIVLSYKYSVSKPLGLCGTLATIFSSKPLYKRVILAMLLTSSR
jgi:hypothetical protein